MKTLTPLSTLKLSLWHRVQIWLLAFLIIPVTSGQTYVYRVIAFNSAGVSTPSNTAWVTTHEPPAPPVAPEALSATATTTTPSALTPPAAPSNLKHDLLDLRRRSKRHRFIPRIQSRERAHTKSLN